MTAQTVHLMLVDPYETGHHGYYIEVLCRRWVELNPSAPLSIVVNRGFRTLHPQLVEWIETRPEMTLIEADFRTDGLDSQLSLVRADRGYGRVITEIIEENRPDRVVLMCFDHLQVSLSFSLRFSFDVSFSGIYFRPIIHYGDTLKSNLTWRNRLKSTVRQVLLRLACRNPHLATVFSLDPFLPDSPEVATMSAQFVALPEPTPELNVSQRPSSETKTISLVGALSRRKGVLELLEAVSLLPERIAGNVRIVMAGPVSEDLKQPVGIWRRKLESKDIRLDVTDRFLSDLEIETAIARSHLVLLPYRDHVGMSNLLVRAAKYGRPVLGPDSGLLGALINLHGLGASVDTKDPLAIARALERFLDSETAYPFDPNKAMAFAKSNTETAFADTVLDLAR